MYREEWMLSAAIYSREARNDDATAAMLQKRAREAACFPLDQPTTTHPLSHSLTRFRDSRGFRADTENSFGKYVRGGRYTPLLAGEFAVVCENASRRYTNAGIQDTHFAYLDRRSVDDFHRAKHADPRDFIKKNVGKLFDMRLRGDC